VLIRSGRAIEILAKVDTIVCDKTGTLTIGHAGVNDVDVMSRFSKEEVLCYAASAEKGLTHPIAEAIVHHAKDTGVALKDCEEWEYKVGLGAVATIDGMSILVGSPRFMKQENISLDEYDLRYPDAKSGGQSLVYIAGDGQLLGVIRYSDPPRPESKEVIQELKRMGITVQMLTGDVQRVADSIAGNLGIRPEHVHAEAFPEKKVEVVKAVHDQGRTVAFCGDGINDSAALAYADVSVSFAGATDIARETADVVLMEDDLRGLIMAIKCARQAMDIIWQNTAIVALPNLGALVVGIFLALDPILAVVINNGTAIMAELNGLRPLIGPGGDIMPTNHRLSAEELAEQEKRLQEMAQSSTSKVTDQVTIDVPASSNHQSIDADVTEVTVIASSIPETNHPSNHSNGHSASHTDEAEMNGKSEVNGNAEVVVSVNGNGHSSAPLPLGMLKQNDLAKRLNIATQTITAKRSKPEFADWSQSRDPEGIAWCYEPGSKVFHTVASDILSEKKQSQMAHVEGLSYLKCEVDLTVVAP